MAHVGLQQVQDIGEIGWGDPRHNGPPVDFGRCGAHGAQGVVGGQLRRFDILIGQPGQNGKGVDRNGHGTGEGAQAKQERSQQR